MKRLWEYNPGSSSAVRVAAAPTTAGRAATKGWVLYCNDARTDAEGRGRQQYNTWAGERSVSSCVTCACSCRLLLRGASVAAKRRGGLELMRNEEDDDGQTQRWMSEVDSDG